MNTRSLERVARPTSVVAILNPVAGTTNAHRVAGLLADVAESTGTKLKIRYSRGPGGIEQIARESAQSADRLIAVGGDGTFSEVAAGVRDANVSLAIVAAGSSNMVARELGLPLHTRAAVELALTGTSIVGIDTATAGSRHIVHMAGAGFDAAIMRDTPAWLKRRIGSTAYVVGALRNVGAPAFPVSITIDGATHESEVRVVLIAIGGSIMRPRYQLGQGIDRTDGVLDILTFNPPHALGIVTTTWWIAVGKAHRARWRQHLLGKHVRLESSESVLTEIDGDVYEHLPLEVQINPYRTHIVVPD